jgi:superfamily I DNA/RNA helicase
LQVSYRAADGRITLGVADITQEQIAREGLHDRPAPREELEASQEGRRAAANVAVRMVRGPAGTGKTLVLILRAKYLARLHPEWRILVVAFNRALAEQLRGHFDHYSENIHVGTFHQLCQQVLTNPDHWGQGPIDDQKARISAAANAVDGAARLGAAFLLDEIKWMKEVGATDLDRYLDIPRLGRGRALPREERETVYRVFRAYQDQLLALRRFDWEDTPGMALAALREAPPERFRYDAILVDEAQDFAPVWFDVLRRMLNPATSNMFLAADGAQRIYRHYSWRALGLDVVGRSRVLRRAYRNTFEIAQVSRRLLRDEPSVLAVLKQEEDEPDLVEPEERWMRHGPRPSVHSFAAEAPERKWLENRLKELLSDGVRPEEIAVFERETATLEATAAAMRKAGLPVRRLSDHTDRAAVAFGTMHAAKGLEFRVVFVMRLDQLFRQASRWRLPEDEQRRYEASEMRLLYVAMTRARDRLYLEYRYPLPKDLERFVDYVKHVD